MCHEHVLTQDPERLLEADEEDEDDPGTGSSVPDRDTSAEVPA